MVLTFYGIMKGIHHVHKFGTEITQLEHGITTFTTNN